MNNLRELVMDLNNTVCFTDITNLNFDFSLKDKSYKLSELKRSDFADKPEVLNKYFSHNNKELDRFHIPEITAEDYNKIVSTLKKVKESNKLFKNASQYFKDKVTLMSIAEDLGCKTADIDLSDYIKDERYYLYSNFIENIMRVDDLFRENGSDYGKMSAIDAYIKNEPRKALVDIELFDNLYSFCIKAIITRKVMLLSEVENCINVLIGIVDYTNGFTTNCTAMQNAQLRKYNRFFTDLLSDTEFKEFLKEHNDMTVYCNEDTISDYINTYKKVLKKLSGIAEDTELEYFYSMLNMTDDPYIDYICGEYDKTEEETVYAPFMFA